MPTYSLAKPLRAALLATALVAAPLAAQQVFFTFPADASGFPGSFSGLVQAAKPSVVTVLTKSKIQPALRRSRGGPDIDPDGPFRDFLERYLKLHPTVPGQRGEKQPAPRANGLGSGFIIDKSGLIVTNHHVIDGASEVIVKLDDGTELPARVVGSDDKTDIAVLRITSTKPLPVVSWGDSDTLKVGDWVLAIGNPFGLGGTVTSGIVSARGRDIRSGPYDDFIQVDAAINRGNSGGPLFNTSGQVVGINTAIFSPNGGNVGLGFAVPANQAKAIVAQILDHGSVERGFIGVTIQTVTPDIAESLGLAKAAGALVTTVKAGGPADRAGMRQGDVIIGVAGDPVGKIKDLTRAVAAVAPGRETMLKIWRGGESQNIPVTVGRMASTKKVAAASPVKPEQNGVAVPGLGLTLAEIPPGSHDQSGHLVDTKGALVAVVEPGKPADVKGVEPGDVILAVSQTAVASAQEARAAIDEITQADRKAVLLLIQRRGRQHYVAVPFAKA
jgi:serine protease Do